MAASVDTSAAVTGTVSAVSFSTSSANDLILVLIWSAGSGTPTVTGISDSASQVSWQTSARKKQGTASAGYEEWYGIASGTLSSDTITVAFSGTRSNGSIQIISITGYNASTPFDTNASIPQLTTASAATETLTISTSNGSDLLIAAVDANASLGSVVTIPAGFTAIQGGALDDYSSCYESVSSTQSSLAVTYSWTTSRQFGMVVDAIQSGSGSSPVTIDLSSGSWSWGVQSVAANAQYTLAAQSWSWGVQAFTFQRMATLASRTWSWATQSIQIQGAVGVLTYALKWPLFWLWG